MTRDTSDAAELRAGLEAIASAIDRLAQASEAISAALAGRLAEALAGDLSSAIVDAGNQIADARRD